jgi:adhesin/invasin
VTGITITTTSAVAASGAAATAEVDATYSPDATPAPSDFFYTVTNGADKDVPAGTGHACAATAPHSIKCTVANTSGHPTTDTVVVFEDTGTTAGVLDSGDVGASPTPVIFSGAPDAVSWDTKPATGTTDTCAVYTAHATLGGSGAAAGDQPLTLSVSETTTGAASANSITLLKSDCTTVVSSGGNATAAGGTTTYTPTVTTAADGTVSFGIKTSAAGSGTLKLSVPSNTSTSTGDANVTWSTGGANSVTNLAVSPTSTTQLSGTIASFTVTATNGTSPVQGVTVQEQTDASASPANADTVAATTCGTTNSSGQVTCTVHNGGTAGADKLIFWVENTSGTCSHTPGPDSCEPQATATATFNAAPSVDSGHSSLTCTQQLSADKGKAKADCTVPTSQTSVVFTATVEDVNGKPIANAPVTFTATSAKIGGATLTGSNLPATQTVNTGTTGTATFTVNDASPAAGDNVTVAAKVGAVSVGTATAHWAAPVATKLSVPNLTTVQVGKTVTVKATVTDQFGTPVSGSPAITYFVSGRNTLPSAPAAADGTITYTDAGGSSTVMSDTISVSDAADHLTATAAVHYVTGTTTPTTVTVDTSGSGTSDATCAVTGHTAATGVAFQHDTTVCALVVNEKGEPLAGDPVTFTVDKGQVDATGAVSSTSTKTYTATTDAAGVALADVTSTTTGAQTVTAKSGSVTGTGTITYSGPATAQAYAIALTPAAPTVAPGAAQKFTAAVTDVFGNSVSGVSISFTQSGPGSLSGASSATVPTGPDGTASVTLATAATDTGSGSVIATIATAGTQCATATTGAPPSNCSATATYTVAVTGNLALTLAAERNAKAGTHERITATVTNADHTPAANQIVRFFVSGANTVQANATTDATGHAHIAYLAKHHGTDTVAVYVDANTDQIRQADEPKQSITAHILGRERPHLRLTSNNGRVKAHVNTRPNADHAVVRYYVKRHGHWHKLGSSHTNGHGNDHHSFKFKVGSHHKLRAKVSATAITTAGTSPAKKIRVKR